MTFAELLKQLQSSRVLRRRRLHSFVAGRGNAKHCLIGRKIGKMNLKFLFVKFKDFKVFEY
jgi:hypothetical protein